MAYRWLIALLACALLFALERPCRADERGVQWAVTRAPDAETCPDAPALEAAVRQARGPQPAAPTAVQLEVAFAREGGRYTATVRARGARSGVRSFVDESDSCGPITDAVVATLTVLLDSSHAAETTAPAAAPVAPSPVTAKSLLQDPEGPEGGPDRPYSALRIGIAGSASLMEFERSSTSPRSETGFAVTTDLRIHPHSQHGLLLGLTSGAAIFGPGVTIVDAAYSLALMEPQPLDRVSVLAYLDFGPAMGFVTKATPVGNHTVLGGRASVALDLQLGHFTLGVTGGYRGGVPLGNVPDRWEGAYHAGLRIGGILELDKQGGK